MRLLNSRTCKLEDFSGKEIPGYAILSHRWEEEEMTLQDLQEGNTEKLGYKKVKAFADRAAENGISYVWVDTCCIDKTSSAELSEAINSMYRWYNKAKICYAYLSKVPAGTDCMLQDSAFAKSEWFTRGWTLQELIASQQLMFYAKDWSVLGTKFDLQTPLSKITGIDVAVLQGRHPGTVSIAQRMSWASGRSTTRDEDMAYCLLGIFDVNMPLLYGEGEKAFIRLQEEIMRISNDHSLFAWKDTTPGPNLPRGPLARNPKEFAESHNIIGFTRRTPAAPYSMTNKGLRIELPLALLNGKENIYLAALDCEKEGSPAGTCFIYLRQSEPGNQYFRIHSDSIFLGTGLESISTVETIYIGTTDNIGESAHPVSSRERYDRIDKIFIEMFERYHLKSDYPPEVFREEGEMLLSISTRSLGVSETLLYHDEERREPIAAFAAILIGDFRNTCFILFVGLHFKGCGYWCQISNCDEDTDLEWICNSARPTFHYKTWSTCKLSDGTQISASIKLVEGTACAVSFN
jgi:hypothetical protein